MKGAKRGGKTISPTDRISVVAHEVSLGSKSGRNGARIANNQTSIKFEEALRATTNLL